MYVIFVCNVSNIMQVTQINKTYRTLCWNLIHGCSFVFNPNTKNILNEKIYFCCWLVSSLNLFVLN